MQKGGVSAAPISTMRRRTPAGRCARASNGHAPAEPAIPFNKSRRRIAQDCAHDGLITSTFYDL